MSELIHDKKTSFHHNFLLQYRFLIQQLAYKCMTSEKQGRNIFYGAMVTEGVIALIWASAGIAFYYNPAHGMGALLDMGGGNSAVVYEMSLKLLGPIGGALAMIGGIACPITSGDTAFRSARLTISDWFKIDQKNMKKRLALSAPLLIAGYFISMLDYQVVWRYFSWANQTLAMLALWAGAVYLCRFVTMTYILYAPEGLNLGAKGYTNLTYAIGLIFALVLASVYIVRTYIPTGKDDGRLDRRTA